MIDDLTDAEHAALRDSGALVCTCTCDRTGDRDELIVWGQRVCRHCQRPILPMARAA